MSNGQPERPPVNMWFPGLVVALLAATGYLLHQNPLETFRPKEKEWSALGRTKVQDVEARLWEDPFSAVDRYMKFSLTDEKLEKHAAEICKSAVASGGKAAPHTIRQVKLEIDSIFGQSNSPTKSRSKQHREPTSEGDSSLPSLTVLGVNVPSSPYAEQAERRRRIRYAVLSGLNRLGFEPNDQERVGFIYRCSGQNAARKAKSVFDSVIPLEFLTLRRSARDEHRAERHVLLLWLDDEALRTCPIQTVKSLWKGITPLTRLDRMKYVLLGPSSSGALKVFVEEALGRDGRCKVPVNDKTDGISDEELRARAAILSPWASAADHELYASLRPQPHAVDASVPNEVKVCERDRRESASSRECSMEALVSRQINMLRLTPDDTLLSQAILNELAMRGVDPGCAAAITFHREAGKSEASILKQGGCSPASERAQRHRLLLISEFDTPYQRLLRRTLRRVVQERCKAKAYDADAKAYCTSSAAQVKDADRESTFNWVYRFSYLRGVDGQTADVGPAYPKAKDNDQPKIGLVPTADDKPDERAEGNTQFDYLRRLGHRIAALEKKLAEEGKSGFGAIGVLGTDPYDRLTILQALREEFPDRLFFTTGLDARFLYEDQRKWARNVLVVSPFGLELTTGLQYDIPPFRESVQTATYFATISALADHSPTAGPDSASWFAERQQWIADQRALVVEHLTRSLSCPPSCPPPWLYPRVFEIGRNQAFSFVGAAPWVKTKPASSQCYAANVLQCKDVHPPRSEMYPRASDELLKWIAIVAGAGALLIVILWPSDQYAEVLGKRTLRGTVGVASLFIAPGSSQRILESVRGSKWLGFAARLLLGGIVVVVLGFIVYSWNGFWTWATENGAGEPAVFLEGISVWPSQILRLLAFVLAAWFLGKSVDRLSQNRITIRRRFDTIDKDPAWEPYRTDTSPFRRWTRVILGAVLYLVVGWYVFRIWPSVVSVRGTVAEFVNFSVILATIFMFNILVIWVWDEVERCGRFIDLRAQEKRKAWDQSTMEVIRNATNVKEEYLGEWIDVQIIALRTSAVAPIVYGPFIVLFLILLARAPIFDRWNVPVSLILMISISLTLVIAASLRLRWAAERARSWAIRRLTERRIAAQGDAKNRVVANQLRTMIDQIRGLRAGAFAPYSEQPFIRALLLPLAGYAGSLLLEFLLYGRP